MLREQVIHVRDQAYVVEFTDEMEIARAAMIAVGKPLAVLWTRITHEDGSIAWERTGNYFRAFFA